MYYIHECVWSGSHSLLCYIHHSENSELKPVLSDYPDYDHLINQVLVQLEGNGGDDNDDNCDNDDDDDDDDDSGRLGDDGGLDDECIAINS